MDWSMTKYPMYYGGVKQAYPNVAPGDPIFSRAVKVGNLIFLSSMSGRTYKSTWNKMDISDKVEEQLVVSLNKLKDFAEELGSSMNNFIRTNLWVRRKDDLPKLCQGMGEYYQKHAPLLVEEPPVLNIIQPLSMAHPLYMEEVGAIAVESMDKPGWEVKKYPMLPANGIPVTSKAAVVGNLVFLADMNGRNLQTGEVPANLEGQIVMCLDKLRSALQEAGSSMNNLIKTVIRLRHREDLSRLQKVELDYYRKYAPLLVEEPPISSAVHFASLTESDYLVEIEALAVQSRDRPGWEMKKYSTYYDVNQAYTKSVVVGRLVFCSGANPRNPETGEVPANLEGQMVMCFDKIRFALEEAGSSMNDLFRYCMFPSNAKCHDVIWKTELEYYLKHTPLLAEEPPMCGPLQPRTLSSPEHLIELGEVTAIIPE